MLSGDEDETTVEKILEAASQIRAMAGSRPQDAPMMLEQARYLTALAEQIRSDVRKRYAGHAAFVAGTRALLAQDARQKR